MSTSTSSSTTGSSEPTLTEQQRKALTDELFRLHGILEPDHQLCFCGDDRRLIESVRELRGRVERELGDDEPEL